MTATTALFCAADEDATDPTLTPSQSAVLLDMESTYLVGMIFDPEVNAEEHWHIVREGDDIRLPAWLVRDLFKEGWR